MGYNRTMSATHKEHIAQSRKGQKHTQETKNKISMAIKKKWMEATPTQANTPNTPNPTK